MLRNFHDVPKLWPGGLIPLPSQPYPLWSIPSLRRWGELCQNMAQHGRPQSGWKAACSPFTIPSPISTGGSRVRGRYGWQREGGGKGMEEEGVEMCSAVSRCKEVTSVLWGQCWGPSGLSQHPMCWPRSSFQTSLDGAVEKLWELRFQMQTRKFANRWVLGFPRQKKKHGVCLGNERVWAERKIWWLSFCARDEFYMETLWKVTFPLV